MEKLFPLWKAKCEEIDSRFERVTIIRLVFPWKIYSVETLEKLAFGSVKNNNMKMKNKIIYFSIALLVLWGGIETIKETQALPYNANFITSAFLVIFEIWWYKFCWSD